MQLIYLLLLLSLSACYSKREYITDLESKPSDPNYIIKQKQFHNNMNKIQTSLEKNNPSNKKSGHSTYNNFYK